MIKIDKYIILDDVYFDYDIMLIAGKEIEAFNKETDEIIITTEQLTELLRDIIKYERDKKEVIQIV